MGYGKETPDSVVPAGDVVYNVKIYCSIGGVKLNLSVQIFASLVLSVVVGLVLGDGAIGPVKAWIAPVGTMFINLIKMMIVPVVLCSLVVGMTSMGI